MLGNIKDLCATAALAAARENRLLESIQINGVKYEPSAKVGKYELVCIIAMPKPTTGDYTHSFFFAESRNHDNFIMVANVFRNVMPMCFNPEGKIDFCPGELWPFAEYTATSS